MPTMRISLLVLASLLFAPACTPGPECAGSKACRASRDSDEQADASATTAQALQCTTFGSPHIGLGGVDVAAVAEGAAAGDRARAKPYSALVGEYSRVLGADNVPASLGNAATTFGVANDRWYLEPVLSAVFLNMAFDVAFEGCVKLTAPLPAPTKDSATTQCTAWTRLFWSREATPDQLDACVSVALESPDRPWAYACASVLSSTGFLTY